MIKSMFIGTVIILFVAGFFLFQQVQKQNITDITFNAVDQDKKIKTEPEKVETGSQFNTSNANIVTQPQDQTITSTKHIASTSKTFSYDAEITATENCNFEECFKKRFTDCQAAVATADIEGPGAVRYKILNKVSGGCLVSFQYTKYPDPEWVNKEMRCVYNNTLDFDQAYMAVFSTTQTGNAPCTGPLYDILGPKKY